MTRKADVHVAVTVTICDQRFEVHRMHKKVAKLRLLLPLLLETFNMPESRDIMVMLIGASYAETCLYLSALALVLYDYLLTAGDEYCYMWKSELSFASALFFAFRYCAVFDTAVAVLSLMTLSSWPVQLVSDILRSESSLRNVVYDQQSCAGIIISQMVFDIVLLASAAAFAALRIYAIYDRNKAVFGLVLCLGLLNPALTVYSFISMNPQTKMEPDLGFTCSFVTRIPESVYDKWMISGRASSVLADFIVFVLTWVKTRPFMHNGIQNGLQRLMLMDTAWYFGILSIINVVSMGVGHLDTTSFNVPFAAWTSAMTSIMLSRLMLNLRKDYAKRKEEILPTDPTSLLFTALNIDADNKCLADDNSARIIDGNPDSRMENILAEGEADLPYSEP